MLESLALVFLTQNTATTRAARGFDSGGWLCQTKSCCPNPARPRRSVPCRSGGIGRRAWFRSMYPQGCGGSSPFFGTSKSFIFNTYFQIPPRKPVEISVSAPTNLVLETSASSGPPSGCQLPTPGSASHFHLIHPPGAGSQSDGSLLRLLKGPDLPGTSDIERQWGD
jgi:hypothetical protein